MVYLVWSLIFVAISVAIFSLIGFFIHPDIDDFYKAAICIAALFLLEPIRSKRKKENENIKVQDGIAREENDKVDTLSWESSQTMIRKHEEKVQKPKETEYRETKYIESKLIKCEYCYNLTVEQGIGGYVDGKPMCKYCFEGRYRPKDSPKNYKSKTHKRYIPSDIRKAVWIRDKGKCVKCGKKKNIQFDHIIPISKGGSSTVKNIELLCQRCNIKKLDKIE